MHVHPDIIIDLVGRERRLVAASRRTDAAAGPAPRTGRRARLGTAVAGRAWRGRTAAA